MARISNEAVPVDSCDLVVSGAERRHVELSARLLYPHLLRLREGVIRKIPIISEHFCKRVLAI